MQKWEISNFKDLVYTIHFFPFSDSGLVLQSSLCENSRLRGSGETSLSFVGDAYCYHFYLPFLLPNINLNCFPF